LLFVGSFVFLSFLFLFRCLYIAFGQMEENDRQGRIPLHRTREWKRNERERMKIVKKEEWFKKGGYESPTLVPATPKAELKKKLQKKIDETDIKTKVIEKTGNTLKRCLQKTSISDKKECEDEECKICKTSKVKGLCREEGVTYEIVCRACKDKHMGETGRSAWAGVNEHLYESRVRKESYVLWRHCKEEHESEEQEFVYRVRDVFGSDAALGQVTEAVDIRRESSGMNNKGEWGDTSLPRLVMEWGQER